MKHVTFARAMQPYNTGEKRIVPDDVAIQLEKDGAVSHSEDWPQREDVHPQSPKRPILNLKRPVGTTDKRLTR